ncbi:MAG: class II fructose-bisphosphate aldolase, partial [Candidatus Paceibacterota bacterium]
MNLINYLKRAKREGWAVGQFNVSNLETMKAVVAASEKEKSPVIVGTSEGESSFLGLKEAVALVKVFKEKGVSLFLHLDHGKTFDYIKKAVDAGYDSVHFDGSKLPLKENISITKKVMAYCKKRGVQVEGEVGSIGGSSTVLKEIPKLSLTEAKEAERFVKETKVDSLAVSVGNFHGVSSSGNPEIDFLRLKEISKAVKDTPLVLHGGSGIPGQSIKKAIGLGMSKVNVNTDLRVAYTETLRDVLKSGEIVPYKYMPRV